MHKSLFGCLLVLATASVILAGPIGEQVTTAPPQNWYADTECQIGLSGIYAFGSGDSYGTDRYLGGDNSWGGSVDAKYFFHRYFGLGFEGYALDATREVQTVSSFHGVTTHPVYRDTRVIGAPMATVTLRYPIGASRFSPYGFAGGGAIFGGGEEDRFVSVNLQGAPAGTNPIRRELGSSTTKAAGQFGGGFELRLTPHFGLTSDFSWNVIDGAKNNFGMARSGLTFAF